MLSKKKQLIAHIALMLTLAQCAAEAQLPANQQGAEYSRENTDSSVLASQESMDKKLSSVEAHIAQFRVKQEDFEKLEEILQSHPEDCYAHFLLGRCFERNGLIDMAEEQFKTADKLESKPEDILRRMRHHIEAGELSEAFNMRTLVWQKSPADPNLQLLQAFFMQENGVLDNAEAIYKVLLKRADCPLGAATGLATIKMDRKEWKEAINLAELDLQKHPAFVSAILVKGQSLLALGNEKETIALLTGPLADHPFNRRFNLLMYTAYRKIGHYDESLRCALRNLAGSDWISYYEDAQKRVKELLGVLPPQKAETIVSEISKEVDRTNYAMKFHFYLGQVYFNLGQAIEASRENKIAIDMDPEFQPNWIERAKIKEVFYRDYKSAAADYKQAYDMHHSDYDHAFLGFRRMRAKLKNADRDIALKIKNAIKR